MTDTFGAPIRLPSVPEEIHRRILLLLTERQLVPGSQLPPERELAQMIGVSRTTVRDALRSLADRGLLRARQGSGWYVEVSTTAVIADMALHFKLSDMTFAQVMEARATLEPTVAALAAQRRSPAQLHSLVGVVARMEAASSGTTFTSLTDEFHALLVECAHNPFFNLCLTPIYQLMKESREPVRRTWSWADSLKEHRDIARAIEHEDSEAARTLAQTHVSCVQIRNLNYRKFIKNGDLGRVSGTPKSDP